MEPGQLKEFRKEGEIQEEVDVAKLEARALRNKEMGPNLSPCFWCFFKP